MPDLLPAEDLAAITAAMASLRRRGVNIAPQARLGVDTISRLLSHIEAAAEYSAARLDELTDPAYRCEPVCERFDAGADCRCSELAEHAGGK